MATDGGPRPRPWLRVVALLGAVGVVAGLIAFTAGGDAPEGVAVATVAGRDASSATMAPDPTTTIPVSTTGSTAPTTSTSTSTEDPAPTVPVTAPDTVPDTTPQPGPTASTHRGQVVDAAGNPLAGIFVYESRHNMFRSEAIAVTGADGTYEVPCPAYSLFLWGVGPSIYDEGSAAQNWAPVVAGTIQGVHHHPPPCLGPDGPALSSTMQRGAILTGVLRDMEGQPLRDLCGLALLIDQAPIVQEIECTDSGGRYWQYGLTPGEATMSNMGLNHITIQLVADEVTAVDWTLDEDHGLAPTSPGTMP